MISVRIVTRFRSVHHCKSRVLIYKRCCSRQCLRLCEPEPSEPRHLATWLSPYDCAGFIWAALTQPGITFTAAYAVSANTRRFWELDDRLSYHPRDDAETYANRIPEAADYFAGDQLQGGEYATAGYTLRHAFDHQSLARLRVAYLAVAALAAGHWPAAWTQASRSQSRQT
jgi:hypothetical protein